MRTSDHLTIGEVYSRATLREMFDITDATINTGIFQPSRHESVWLFVTEKKTSDRTGVGGSDQAMPVGEEVGL